MIERTQAEINEHLARIARIVTQWQDHAGHGCEHEITLRQKRDQIRELNVFFYGDRTRSARKRELVAAVESPPVSGANALAYEDEPEEFWWQK